jgi:regulator of RNase E activity RraA
MYDPQPADLPETLERLRRASTASIATELFKHGLRNQVLVDVRPMTTTVGFAAPAFTMRHIPAREDLETLASIREPGNLQWDAVERIEPGQALVIDSRGDTSAGSGGLMLMTRLARRGAVAAITDGAFRDTPDLDGIGIPIYARGQCAATRLSKFHVADLNVPIGCGGVAVFPGDIVVGDRESVVVIPRHLAEEVSIAASDREGLEAWIYRRVNAGEPLAGLYPPNEATLAQYAEWRAKQGEQAP